MKKSKIFNVGDKVFAKVKGYPAWPAKVVSRNDKKYDVLFYGTKETGSLKPEDIFYYLKNKATFLKKPINRKFYPEAVEEIEEEIKNAGGTDGNEENDEGDTSMASNDTLNDSTLENKTTKRKRSKTPEVAPPTKKKPGRKSSVTGSAEEAKTKELLNNDKSKELNEESKDKSEDEDKILDDKAEDKSPDEDLENNKSAENKTLPEKKKRGPKPKNKSLNSTLDNFLIKSQSSSQESVAEDEQAIKVSIISADYLRHIVEYASKVKTKEDLYRKKPVEERNKLENEVVMTKLPSGVYVGVKYQHNEPPKFKSEYEMAEFDENEAKKTLELMEKVQEGTVKPEDEPSLFVMNLNKTDVEVREAVMSKIVERKKIKLNFLKIESNMVDLDTKIKAALGLFNANPQTALEHLEKMLELDITQLMLKKHPHVVDMIKRLRKYIGNMKEWKMTEEEEKNFKANAEKIRAFADKVYQKFKNIFNVDDEKSFWDVFSNEVNVYKEKAKDFSEAQIFALIEEPDSRQAFLDLRLEEIETLEEESSFQETEKQDKENSSQAANGTAINKEEEQEGEVQSAPTEVEAS